MIRNNQEFFVGLDADISTSGATQTYTVDNGAAMAFCQRAISPSESMARTGGLRLVRVIGVVLVEGIPERTGWMRNIDHVRRVCSCGFC